MAGTYLGHLPENDQLFQYLKYEIQPQLHPDNSRLKYRVYRLTGSNDVYLYEEKYTQTRVIGKFFLSHREHNAEVAARRLNREYDNLNYIRSFGFTGYPHYVARPLGKNSGLNQLLVCEYCSGELLSSVLHRSLWEHNPGMLYDKLRSLAYFLATFHNRTARSYRVDFEVTCQYLDGLINHVAAQNVANPGQVAALRHWRMRWHDQPKMWEDVQVVVHGDATPSNFMFGGDLGVISFDMERLREADRLFDTGRLAGELQHFFLLHSGNKYQAEPFIGHFLWEYACHFPDRERTFAALSRRLPFYMGTTLLRIARNDWLEFNYRQQLIYEAEQCFRRWAL